VRLVGTKTQGKFLKRSLLQKSANPAKKGATLLGKREK
jgi:hypothetical protein